MATIKNRRGRKKLEKFFLPNEDISLDQYIQTHKTEIQNHILNCIEYAVSKGLESVEIFKFQDSPYSVNIPQSDYEENVKFIFKTFVDNEKFEYCPRIKKLLEKIQHD